MANESAGGFTAGAAGQSAAASLQYQHFTTDTNAHGFLGGTLGRGNRSVPSPGSFFSTPTAAPQSGERSLSAGQFGAGGPKDSLDPDTSGDLS